MVMAMAMAVAARAVYAQIGDPGGRGSLLGNQVFLGLLVWRSYNLIFRAWLRPARILPLLLPYGAAALLLVAAAAWPLAMRYTSA